MVTAVAPRCTTAALPEGLRATFRAPPVGLRTGKPHGAGDVSNEFDGPSCVARTAYAFFASPTRAWEFAAGAVVAVIPVAGDGGHRRGTHQAVARTPRTPLPNDP